MEKTKIASDFFSYKFNKLYFFLSLKILFVENAHSTLKITGTQEIHFIWLVATGVYMYMELCANCIQAIKKDYM